MPKRTPGGEDGRSLQPSNYVRVLGRHQKLLLNPRVKSWWEGRSLRSRLSADTYLRQLGFLLERLQLTPDEVLRLAQRNPDRLRDLLIKDAAKLKEDGRLDSYIAKFFEGLKSYLKFNRVAFDGFPTLSPIKGESLANERIPSPEELGRVLDRLSLRGRVIALFMAHSGLRPGVLGAYQASDGLRLRDLPDLELGRAHSFTQIPFVIRVPAGLSKTRVSYTTFGGTQLASAFLAYLDDRVERGEKLGPESPAVCANNTRGVALRSQRGARSPQTFVCTNKLVKELHDILSSTAPRGVRWRPYVLRSYCSTRLLMAEGAGKITRDLREALLGHDGGVSARYNLGKNWGPDLLKDARSTYRRAESYLNTVQTPLGEDVQTELRKGILLALEVPEEELRKMDMGEMTTEKFHELVARKRVESAGLPIQTSTRPHATTGASRLAQKVVSEEEVEDWITKGWTVQTQLSSSRRVVLNPPSS